MIITFLKFYVNAIARTFPDLFSMDFEIRKGSFDAIWDLSIELYMFIKSLFSD